MVHFLELAYFLLVIKAILRCLYFWQLKEYRLDRFRSFLTTSEVKRFLLPTRFFLRPRLTLKAFILTWLAFYFSFQILKFDIQSIAVFATYLLIPLTSSLAVLALTPITSLAYWLIIMLAKIKLQLFHQPLQVIGITGSFGKTSTKEILAHLLSVKYSVCKTPATRNTAIGIALTILKDLKKDHQFFVIEMGAYKKGEIKQICRLVKPSYGILTGITKQHLSLFGSLDKIIEAKYELIQSLPASGLAIVNADNPHSFKLSKQTKSVKVKTYLKPKTKYQTNLIGHYQQLNIQAAIVLARHLNINLKALRVKLTSVPSFKTAVTSKIGLNKALIINDSYNSNPEGFKALIDYAKTQPTKTKILITSGIIELGADSNKIHQELISLAETVFDQVIITKKDLSFLASNKTTIETNHKKLYNYLKQKLDSNTLVLLESRLPQKLIVQLWLNQS
jgi:UDP-N-acetylmuramoyl-tripeptide--D-alanyl-D-alanine ligase